MKISSTRRYALRAFVLFLSMMLIGCGEVEATHTSPSAASPTPGRLGCFLQTTVTLTTGSPQITQSEAERRERTNYATSRMPGQLGELIRAQSVVVNSSGNDQVRGRDVWLLVFAWIPPADQPQTLPPGLQYRTYAFVDSHTGQPMSSCTDVVPNNA